MKVNILIIHDITETFKENDKHNFVLSSPTKGFLPSHSPVQRAAIGSTGQAWAFYGARAAEGAAGMYG